MKPESRRPPLQTRKQRAIDEQRAINGRHVSEAIARKAWLFGLVAAALEVGLVIAGGRYPYMSLILGPAVFVTIYATVRWSARWSANFLYPQISSPISSPDPGADVAKNKEAAPWRRERSRAFLIGGVLIGVYAGLGALLWLVGLTGHSRIDLATWILFGAALANGLRYAARLASTARRPEAGGEGQPLGLRVARSLSWLAVLNALLPTVIGIAIFLATGAFWRVNPFLVLSAASGVLYWWRLGRVLGESPGFDSMARNAID